MNMPFGNIQGLMQAYQQFMTNKPKDLGNDPNQIIQKMKSLMKLKILFTVKRLKDYLILISNLLIKNIILQELKTWKINLILK